MSNQRTTASFDNVVTKLREDVPNRALLDGAQAWWSAVAACQQEMAQFVADRLAKDGEAIRETLACRNWTDALAIQRRWVDETLRDYNTEVMKLTALYAKSASSAARAENRVA